jgi:AbrB family looped-hinge helix DNA binding protein
MVRWGMARNMAKEERRARGREAMPEYGESAEYKPIPVYHVVVADRGRLVLPLEIRGRLKIRDGDRVALTLEGDGLVTLQTRDVAIRRLRGMFKHLAKPGRLASDELIAERRREARREERRFREWGARLRKAGK